MRLKLRELKSIEEKILDRTLYLIGKNRSLNVSIRAIANEAEVNVSAINYYFRTKDEMMMQAKELFIINTLTITSILEDISMNPEKRLINSINEIMEYNIRYPGISVLLKDAREKTDEFSVRLINVSNEMTKKINLLLDHVLLKSESNHYKRIIFWSALNYPLEDNGFDNFNVAILRDKEDRISYIKQLLNMLMK